VASALTFFFSDVEGSTRLAAELGTDSFARALDEHRALMRGAFARHGGREVSTGGDSFFAVFESASDAIAAAVDTQRALTRPLPSRVEIRIRIGLHAGNAVRIGDDYLGLDVNRAARIADAGHGGQIVVSDAIHAVVGSLAGDVMLTDLGRHRLKDVGSERLWQVEGPGLPPGPFPPPRSLEAHPTNLPSAAGELIGREVELGMLAEMLTTHQVVTVVGAGGIGKSRVAIETARALVARFPDGVYYLDLAALTTADLAAAALLDVLGVSAGAEDSLEILRTRLRDRELLILLDTADRVAGMADLVASLAAACPRVRLLVTSRTPLRISAERELPIGPLTVAEGARLFQVRASFAHGAQGDPSTTLTIDRLVARLDAIPLAIELAAARARVLTPAAILERLEQRLPALGTGPSDLPDRQRTLDATISWSYEQLEPSPQRLFNRLGVFAGSFDLSAVEGVASEPGDDALASLERLVDRSLVSADRQPDQLAFRLLGPIRDFAAAQFARSADVNVIRLRHAQYHLDVLRGLALALESGDDLAAVAAIERAEPELAGALGWSLDEGDANLGLEMAALLGKYWWSRGRLQEGIGWLGRVLAEPVGPTTDRAVLAKALYWSGVLHDDARRSVEARDRLEQALALQQELNDDRAVARTLNSLGVVARSQGDFDGAANLFADSLERKRKLGDVRGIAATLSNLGILASDRGDLEAAAELFAEALAIDESTGSAGAVAVSCLNLGSVLVRAGKTQQGLEQIRRALPGIAELGDPELVVEILSTLAHVRLEAPDANGPAEAARLSLVAQELRQREGIPLREIERDDVDDLLRRELAILGPDAINAIRAEASVTDLDASVRLAVAAAGSS